MPHLQYVSIHKTRASSGAGIQLGRILGRCCVHLPRVELDTSLRQGLVEAAIQHGFDDVQRARLWRLVTLVLRRGSAAARRPDASIPVLRAAIFRFYFAA